MKSSYNNSYDFDYKLLLKSFDDNDDEYESLYVYKQVLINSNSEYFSKCLKTTDFEAIK